MLYWPTAKYISTIGGHNIQPKWVIDGKHLLHFPAIGGCNIQPYWGKERKHVLHFPIIGGHNIQTYWVIAGKHEFVKTREIREI